MTTASHGGQPLPPPDGPLAPWAQLVAEAHLAPTLPRRWGHLVHAIERAQALSAAGRLGAEDTDVLIAAVALHDIGYSPRLVDTGFAPLDGARWLKRIGVAPRVADLVAHSCYAALEAELRGLAASYEEIADERTPVRDAVWFCCLTAGPDGTPITISERIRGIRERYADDPVVLQYVDLGADELIAAAGRARWHFVTDCPSDTAADSPAHNGRSAKAEGRTTPADPISYIPVRHLR